MPLSHPLASRSSGILLHPTSLPGPYGIGDFGPAAYAWVDALAAAGQSWWQILPLGPTGYGDSPYQCFSAFAGNPNLVSPDLLVEDGLIPVGDLCRFELPQGPTNYEEALPNKRALISKAGTAYQTGAARNLEPEFDQFRQDNADWLDDFALFMVLKEIFGGGSWQGWADGYRLRDPKALAGARQRHADAIDSYRFAQFLFVRQWNRLRTYAHSKGVRIIGDMPIFLAEDSADVWANPHLFQLDADRRPVAVAGVPPDYFSSTGQLWGNPLYDWEAHEQIKYFWWAARMRGAMRQVDLIRLDHFRGFEAYWSVPAGSPTAESGQWVKGPGAKLLTALLVDIGTLPLIAEDLGVITPEVDAMRTAYSLPGMRILQFAFGGAVEERFLPHNYENPTVVYTGTHDNDTTRGWFDTLTAKDRRSTCRYLHADGAEIHWDMIRAAWASVATLAIAPAQDLLGLGTEARMNYPGRPSGNWRWRLPMSGMDAAIITRLGELAATYGRTSHDGRI